MVPVCGPVPPTPEGMVPQAGYLPATTPQMVVPPPSSGSIAGAQTALGGGDPPFEDLSRSGSATSDQTA